MSDRRPTGEMPSVPHEEVKDELAELREQKERARLLDELFGMIDKLRDTDYLKSSNDRTSKT